MDLSRLGDNRPRGLPPARPARTVRWRKADWSATPPQVPGFYHHRDPADPDRVRLATAHRRGDGALIVRLADGGDPVADGRGEWAGPLALTDD